uniref:Uncharacterized protein n=1 Tax=Parascaris equorum TaxID=6256 RepID=A0A914RYS8_PAREQ
MKWLMIVIASLWEMGYTLECWTGVAWISFERPIQSTYVKTRCYTSTQFCVKIHATTNEVYGYTKGCDQELPGLTGVAQCTDDGCRNEKDGEVCCCSWDNCNSATQPHPTLCFILTMVFISRFFVF